MIQRYEITNGAGSTDDLHWVESDNGEAVDYDDCKKLCDEAIKVITELCTVYSVPLPLATIERLSV